MKPTEMTLVSTFIPDFKSMSRDQLKVLIEAEGMKLKNTTSKEVMVKKLSKAWPFPTTLEKFLGSPAARGTVEDFAKILLFKESFHLFTSSMLRTST